MDEFNYAVLAFFESIRNPVLDVIMSVITYLGHEAAFIAVALLIFWCVDKRRGYYVMSSCFIATTLNETLKVLFRVPRPWIRFKDKGFTIVESAREAATGYSFPSGHTTNATSVSVSVIRSEKKHTWVKVIAVVVMCLVPISRVYLGVHTPTDVIVALILASAISLALYPLFVFVSKKPNATFFVLLALSVISLITVLFALFNKFPADIDPANLNEIRKNSFTLLGATLGIVAAYPIEKKYINFSEKATLPGNIVKFVLGLGIIMGIKEGLKAIFKLFANENSLEFMWLRSVRYFAVVFVAIAVYPLLFGFFSGIGKKKSKD